MGTLKSRKKEMLISSLAILAFLALVLARQMGVFYRFDAKVYNWALQCSVFSWNLEVWRFVTILGSGFLVYPAMGIMVIFSFVKKQRIFTLPYLISVTVLCFANTLLKRIFAVQRPVGFDSLVNQPLSFSFPSGHSTNAVLLFFLLPLFMKKIFVQDKIKLSVWQWVLAISGVVLIGLSRLMLGVHWFSDVLAGWTLGIWITAMALLFWKVEE